MVKTGFDAAAKLSLDSEKSHRYNGSQTCIPYGDHEPSS